uniref:Uncharacterized protein n=1 Tax=Entomoneis paludosa TaxID=265537 RepID=A0A7S2YL00_9STRA|mmetsp:Transcript_37540/g.77893  ORF Transcript_37540/g.77893 Transcript_37540/m.77893 type:complete len:147 (+) Transcript_37540:91-531(+)
MAIGSGNNDPLHKAHCKRRNHAEFRAAAGKFAALVHPTLHHDSMVTRGKPALLRKQAAPLEKATRTMALPQGKPLSPAPCLGHFSQCTKNSGNNKTVGDNKQQENKPVVANNNTCRAQALAAPPALFELLAHAASMCQDKLESTSS